MKSFNFHRFWLKIPVILKEEVPVNKLHVHKFAFWLAEEFGYKLSAGKSKGIKKAIAIRNKFRFTHTRIVKLVCTFTKHTTSPFYQQHLAWICLVIFDSVVISPIHNLFSPRCIKLVKVVLEYLLFFVIFQESFSLTKFVKKSAVLFKDLLKTHEF